MNTINTVIKIEDLKKSFKTGVFHIPVLRGVNLEIKKGEFVVIFGPSGVGKSTILNIILGLETPTSGVVSVFGLDIYKMTEDQRADLRSAKFGVVYQQANWIKSLKVMGNVIFPLLIRGMSERNAKKKAAEKLEMIGMYRFIRHSPVELSGGQQQKISLIRALLTNPEIIVGDEPTGNLDAESGDDIMNILKALSVYEKKTIVIVTHNPEYKKYADRLISVENGLVKSLKIKGKKAVKEAKKGQELISLKPEERSRRDISKNL